MFNNDKESYNEKMKRRADILYPTMKDKEINKPKNLPLGKSVYDDDDEGTSIKKLPKVKGELEPLVRDIEKEKTTEHKSRKERTIDEQEKFLDDFYPSMKDVDKKHDINKVPESTKNADKIKETNCLKFEKQKENKDKTLLLKSSVEKNDLKLSDQNFKNSMDIVFKHEGGFVDDSADVGGRTNMGITQKTYDDYCKRHGLEKKDVKNLTKEEAMKVYYNDYWKASGADKIDNQTEAMILFDTAVLHGVGRAKQFYQQSDGDFDKMIQLRKEYYVNRVKKNPSQEKFLKGWNNRADNLFRILREDRKEHN